MVAIEQSQQMSSDDLLRNIGLLPDDNATTFDFEVTDDGESQRTVINA